jgi:hypothetical protein
LFINGSLANADGGAFGADRADAEILATSRGGARPARIAVFVDGTKAASAHAHCNPGCPSSQRMGFTYRRREFGTGTHTIDVTTTSDDGHRRTQTITLLPPPPAESKGAPNPQPAFYITARSAGDLRRQAADDAARFARSQGKGHAQLILDFGAARTRHGRWGVALRQGTFFTDAQVGSALRLRRAPMTRHIAGAA